VARKRRKRELGREAEEERNGREKKEWYSIGFLHPCLFEIIAI